jgi:hypothetical protein
MRKHELSNASILIHCQLEGFMKRIPIISIATLLAIGAPAQASSLFYDSFNAPPGTLLKDYNGYSITAEPIFTASNPGTKTAEIQSPGLSVAGQPSAGNAAYMHYSMASGAAVPYTATKDLGSGAYGAVGGVGINTFYVSALFNSNDFPEPESSVYGVWVKLGIPIDFATGADRYFSIGIKHAAHDYQVFAEGSGTQYGDWKLADYTPGQTVQVVARYVITPMDATGKYRFEVFAAANPMPNVEPTWTFIAGESDVVGGHKIGTYTVRGLDLTVERSGSDSGSGGLIDEIRIGTNYADVVGVVPEPETWAMLLAGFGLVGWKLRRRSDL